LIGITLSNVKFQFNKGAILTPAEKATKTLLNKFGGYCRRIQMNSLKRGKPGQVSQPGKPPLRHSRQVDIKNTVFFFTDVPRKEVVIGMVLLEGKRGEPMPGVLERSGTSRIKSRGKIKTVRVQARPSATPAFDKTIKKQLPALIEGGIMREAR